MGLTAGIYKNGADCSNYGISSYASSVTIVNVEGPFDPSGDRPAVMLVANAMGTARFVPAELERRCVNCDLVAGDGEDISPICSVDGLVSSHSFRDRWVESKCNGERRVGPMMGGCYVSTSDSRFSRAVEDLLGHRFYGAVPLHDRFETADEYRVLSS